eukprot:m.133362 g.133362  ORF g.133362 m.133362 type:complete len:337 (+) comp15799_c0_seq2:249-1259(+)
MKLAVITTSSEFAGNTSLARRVQQFLASASIDCSLLFHADYQDSGQLLDRCQHDGIGGLVGIHAYRSGRLLVGITLPYIVLLGGTDTTIFLEDKEAADIMHKAISGARCVIGFASWMIQALEASTGTLPCPTKIIPQGITTATPTAKLELTTPLRSKVFVLVAGLRPVKDVLFLVNMMDAWHAKDSEVQLVIIGDERDEDYARKARARLQHSSACTLLPPMPQAQLFALLNRAIACVNTSVHEGMCGALLEAMALRVPVLARNIPGNAAIVQHRATGLLFNTPDDFLECAKQLMSDDDLRRRLCENAAEYVARCHSLEVEQRRYIDVVQRYLLDQI